MSKLVTVKVPEELRNRVKVYAAKNRKAVYEVFLDCCKDIQ